MRRFGVEKGFKVLDMDQKPWRLQAGRSRGGMQATKTVLCVAAFLMLLVGSANGQDTVLWRVEFPPVTEVRDQPFVECYNELDDRPCQSDGQLDCKINLPQSNGAWSVPEIMPPPKRCLGVP